MSFAKPAAAILRAAALAMSLTPVVAYACPPPAPISAPPQFPGEADATYYDRLVRMSYPSSWNYVSAPVQAPGENAEAFAARLATFNDGMRAAQARQQAATLVALKREEADRWEQAPQVLLVEVKRSGPVRIKGQEWIETQYRVVKRVRAGERFRTFALRYPGYSTSCGPYNPTYERGTRLVLFTKPGPVSVESLLGTYGNENARDSRTKALLGPAKP